MVIYVLLLIISFLLNLIDAFRTNVKFLNMFYGIAFIDIYLGVLIFKFFFGRNLDPELVNTLSLTLLCFIVFLSHSVRKTKLTKRNIARVMSPDLLRQNIIFFSTASVVLMVLFFAKNGVPLLAEIVEKARTDAFLNDKLLYYVFLVFNPLLIIYTYLFCGKRYFKFFLCISFLLGLLTGFRSLLFLLLVVSVILYFGERKPFSKSYLAWIVTAALMLFLVLQAMTYVRMPEDNRNFQLSALQLIDRIFLVNVRNLSDIKSYFDVHPKLCGLTIIWDFAFVRRLLNTLGWLQQREAFAIWMTYRLNPNASSSFIMTPTIFGIAIANFGIVGPPLACMLALSVGQASKVFKQKKLLKPLYYYFALLALPIFTRGLFTTLALFAVPALMLSYTIALIYSMQKAVFSPLSVPRPTVASNKDICSFCHKLDNKMSQS